MRGILVLSLVAACGSSEDDDGTYLHVHVSAPTAFDRIFVYSQESSPLSPAAAPVTPELLATGDRATVFTALDQRLGEDDARTYSPPRSTADVTIWSLTATFHHVAVVTFLGEAPIGGDATDAITVEYRDSANHADVHLSTNQHVELWGVGTPRCARVVTPTHSYFAVIYDDYDCDGIKDNIDCEPTVYCEAGVPSACGCP